MDAKQSWERLKSQAESSLSADALVAFAEELAQTGEQAVANYAKADPKARRHALAQLWAGGLHGVGALPQFDLCLLAALGHVAMGRQAFLFAPLPAAPSLVRHATQLLDKTLGLNARVSGLVFGQPTSRLKQALQSDIILTDVMQLFDVARDGGGFLQRESTVALICEADLCLYDSRLGIFERGKPQAIAAIYRTTAKTPPWQEQPNVLDTLALFGAFGRVDGVLGYTSGHVAKELRKVYGPVITGGVSCRGTGDFRALAFRTSAEKVSALCRDILKADGDCVVFMGDEEFRQELYRNLRQRDQEPTLLATARDLRTFLGMKSSRKRVGLFRGIPTTFTTPIEERPAMHVFLAEHLLMAHQHGKLKAFCERDLAFASPPTLYFSLEDEMFSIYADRAGVEGFFRLIDFTERYDKWRQIRRVMGKAVLRRIHRLRRACLNEDHPIFTMIGLPGQDQAAGSKPKEKGTRKLGKKLEGLCFCGSGKPFRECHGKPKA